MRHPKAALVERTQTDGRGKPVYETSRSGPDHEPRFRAEVRVDGDLLGTGEAGNKREAERRAAEDALLSIERLRAPAVAVERDHDTPFTGPWPMLEHVLAASLQVAQARVPGELRGDAAREAIETFTLTLYKHLLEDLGEVVEDDDPEGDQPSA